MQAFSYFHFVNAFLYCPETDGVRCPRTAGENGMLLLACHFR
jgi:hypothetical protein